MKCCFHQLKNVENKFFSKKSALKFCSNKKYTYLCIAFPIKLLDSK